MLQVDIAILEMFVANEGHLPALSVERISKSYLLETGHFNILLLPTTNLSDTHSANSAIHLFLSHVRIDTFQDFHTDAI